MKPKRFRLHFNRINMQRGLPNVWTVHNSDGCHQAEQVIVEVPIRTVFKPNGRQPRATFVGTGILTSHGGTTIVITRGSR